MSEQLIAGRFLRREHIGSGGMGTVYRGEDTLTGDLVAIKALRPEITQNDPDLVARFEREGEALRRLNHPNIVKVLATAQDDDTHYIVMEYVSGGSLLDRMREQPLSIPEILNISLDLTDALIRAHRLDIIHRDLKPANVLIGANGAPLLTDFGVARIGGTTTQITETGVVMGTLAYLPPEALSGERIDTRADIWAFGVMLYEMIAGVRPFVGDNTAAILRRILYEPVQDVLKHREPGEVPFALAGLIYWMLEKERDDRPASIRLVGAMLENILTGKDLPLNWFGDGSNNYEVPDIPRTPTPSYAANLVREYTTSSMNLDELRVPVEAPDSSTERDLQVQGTIIMDATPETPADGWKADPSISRSDWSISLKRELNRPPRIFISYRAEDSTAITGRIYDRLALAFGNESVFKDVDDVPLGSDFERALEQQIAACDVALIIIGQRWLNAADEDGRLLDQVRDFVRIEVTAALKRDDLLVIPVLVDDAAMPEQRLLPTPMQRLTYRNAALVRNDPDFNRDVEWLINQIHNAFIIKHPPREISPLALVIASLLVALAILSGIGIFSLVSNMAAPGAPTSAEAAAPVEIAPIEDNRFLVLVAQPRPIDVTDAQAQQVQASIVDDMELNFRDVQFGLIATRPYPGVIRTDAEARQIAETYNAGVIIWGTYNGEFAQLEVQLGDAEVFPEFVFEREEVQTLSDATYRIADPQTETLGFGAIATLNIAFTFANDTDGISRNLLNASFVSGTPAAVVGNTPAAAYHRYVSLYIDETAAGIEFLSEALTIQPDNRGLYASRALGYLRLGELTNMESDVRSAQQFGNENWISPTLLLVNANSFIRRDYDSAIEGLNSMIEVVPDDWFLLSFRGSLHYLRGEYEQAERDLNAALENEPQANFPHAGAIGLALRDADFARAQALVTEVATRFPDPRYMERLVVSVLSEDASETILVPFLASFTNLTRDQWDDALDDAREVQQFDELVTSDTYFIEGFAHCNLGNFAEAEAAYTAAIERDPGFTLLYLLRAEVRGYQLDLVGAAQDLNTVRESAQAAAYEPLVAAVAAGELSCQSFLEADFSQLTTTETEEAP